nr:MAG TPA: Terminase small subunit [Caudoviricetes sp.]
MAKLTRKQELFAVEYVRLKGNGTQAAIAAGYSKKTAAAIARENLRKLYIKNRIEELTEKADAEKVADAKEVLQLLTEIVRGEMSEEVVALNPQGEESRTNRKPTIKDRSKALEILSRCLGMTLPETQVNVTPVIITGEDKLDE